ncbi:hypothetical protein RRG08_045848 [Elysia crispata]|uniref:Uncharacterized protein n=1 Tax=Elysia crispata TaxID=231223 RepID=A0AAE1B333_9GAST|nr:hypothetical protein RRG08_045848 [Elysia crispata]
MTCDQSITGQMTSCVLCGATPQVNKEMVDSYNGDILLSVCHRQCGGGLSALMDSAASQTGLNFPGGGDTRLAWPGPSLHGSPGFVGLAVSAEQIKKRLLSNCSNGRFLLIHVTHL